VARDDEHEGCCNVNEISALPIVLVVDDNALNLELLKTFLGILGCGVLALEDGADVTETVKQHRPALVLLDIYMPGISGFEAVRELKADAGTRDVPVYAFTALDPTKLADNRDMSLFSGVLRKPPNIGSLKRVLETVGILPADCR
jgi:CheY-like chemotaxis protein